MEIHPDNTLPATIMEADNPLLVEENRLPFGATVHFHESLFQGVSPVHKVTWSLLHQWIQAFLRASQVTPNPSDAQIIEVWLDADGVTRSKTMTMTARPLKVHSECREDGRKVPARSGRPHRLGRN